jgi:hypothetical protein
MRHSRLSLVKKGFCKDRYVQLLFLFSQTNHQEHLGVDTITIYGFDFAIYLSDTSLTSACCPGGKKSASSNSMKDTLGKPRIASK